MKIDPIKNGIVIDHIEAGKGMAVYNILSLGDLDCTVALIKNVPSKKTGKKSALIPAVWDESGQTLRGATQIRSMSAEGRLLPLASCYGEGAVDVSVPAPPLSFV